MTRFRLEYGGYTVDVWDEGGERHHLPHCRVQWDKGSASVALPSLRVLAGTPLPRRARDQLVERLDEIIDEWDRLNPEREIH